jgi:hypothetical protein
MKDKEYCDHCGDELPAVAHIVVPSLSQDIASANKGESAVMCYTCYFTCYNKELN